jgi:hypothetical protein
MAHMALKYQYTLHIDNTVDLEKRTEALNRVTE